MSEKKMSRTHRLVLMAMLTAVQIVLSRFLSINLWNLKIGFAFVPIALAGMLLGPVSAGLTGVVADLIGATLFPSGAFFPGFTLTSAVVGVLYALPLYKKQPCWIRAAAAAVLGMIPNLFLNSLWLSMLYTSKAYWGWVVARASSYLIEIPVQVVLIYLCLEGLSRMKLPASVRLPKKEKKA